MDHNHGVAITGGFELVGREKELELLAAFVDALPRGSGAALVHGEAGIGKTMLWRACLESAQQSGVRVLRTRCAEAEMPLALGGLGDLFELALSEVGDELPELHRRALAVVIGLEAAADGVPDRLALPRAFLALVRALAAGAPTLLAIDDVQWLDPPSQRILAFAASRLGDARVGILATQRGDAGDLLDLRRAFDERLVEIRVGPLSVGALHHLIRTRLGARIPRPTVARVHEASAGNPMFALEFARTAARAGPGGVGTLPVPSSLEELVRERVAAYPARIRPLLAAAAAAERPTLALLGQAVEDAEVLLDQAIAEGAVMLEADDVVRFLHPLLASAVYAHLAPSRRRALHARLAAVTEDLEERARHLALATVGPDAGVARLLEEQAVLARARGSPDTAVLLAREAVRLTPQADDRDREERSLAVAGYLADAGHVADAAAWLDRLLADGIMGARRARALLIRFELEHDMGVRRRLVGEALDHVGEDIALRARVLIAASNSRANWGEWAASEALARRALAEAEQVDDPALLATALTTVALRSPHPEPESLERAIALADVHGCLPRSRSPRVALAESLLLRGELTSARELLEGEVDLMRRRGQQLESRRPLFYLALLETAAGNWDHAERYLGEVWELAFDSGDRFWEEWVWFQRAQVAALRGHVDEARRQAARSMAYSETHWPGVAANPRWVIGRLELSLGNAERAWELLEDVLERDDLFWFATPAIPDAVEALVLLGRLEEAERIIARFEPDWLDHLWGTPTMLRCRALVLLARDECDGALAAAEEAAARFETSGFPLERGRSLLVVGDALRRMGERRRAAEKLEAAMAIFGELGAALWLGQAEQELRRARPRPRRDRQLTTAERRVAALVAAGRTNREVSAQLFTTVGTVEVHLTRIYRKVGVRSRTELARRVAEGTLDLADE